jgi:hypothetical protein
MIRYPSFQKRVDGRMDPPETNYDSIITINGTITAKIATDNAFS